MSTSDAPPMVKALLADPKANLIMQLILNNRIGEFRQGLNKGVVKGYPVDFFPEEYINLYSIYAVPYANKKDPSVNIDDWLNELEFMRMKMKNMAEVEEEDRALNREKADKRKELILRAPYDTEITEEEYNLHVPASQKYLWKVSRTESVQTGMQEYREEKFYKKYRPGESPDEQREKERILISNAPYDTEITEKVYKRDIPDTQKHLWKVSRTEREQTGRNEFTEHIFYKKYRPGQSPDELKHKEVWETLVNGGTIEKKEATSILTPKEQRQLIFSHTESIKTGWNEYAQRHFFKLAPPAAKYEQPPIPSAPPAAKYEQPLQYREPPIPSAPPAANYQQPPQYNISPLQRLDLQLAQLYAKKGEIDFTTDLDQNQKEIFSRTTPKERVQLKAKYGKKMGFFNQATNLGRRLFSWGGRGKISRKSIMAKLSCPRCTRSCRTMRSMMKHLKAAHGMKKTTAKACCRKAMKTATRKAKKGSRRTRRSRK